MNSNQSSNTLEQGNSVEQGNTLEQDSTWVSLFRHASPYIKAHQNKTMVLALSGAMLQSRTLENRIHDIALLNSLGVKLVLVIGARPQIDECLKRRGLESRFHNGLRVTEADMLSAVIEAYGSLRTELESRLSMGVVNSPMDGAQIKVASGNYVMAQPVGVLEGVDFGCTGTFRKLDTESIEVALSNRSVVLIPALGYSMTGEVFNLAYEALAAEVASQLKADKLVLFNEQGACVDSDGEEFRHMSLAQAQAYLSAIDAKNRTDESGFDQRSNSIGVSKNSDTERLLKVAMDSCLRGVARAHLVSYARDDAFLRELFTRDGSGTMVSHDGYDELRRAQLDDVNGILELIRPLEEKGVLVRRSRERVESEINSFLVNVRDGAVVACVALYEFPDADVGELSCFAVDSAYRKEGRGDRLLTEVESIARQRGMSALFVLTTQTEHWFKERGFSPVEQSRLPESKRYNPSRNARVLLKSL